MPRSAQLLHQGYALKPLSGRLIGRYASGMDNNAVYHDGWQRHHAKTHDFLNILYLFNLDFDALFLRGSHDAIIGRFTVDTAGP